MTAKTTGLVSNTTDFYMYIIEDLSVYRSKFNLRDSKHVSLMVSNKETDGKILVYFQKKTKPQGENEVEIKSMKHKIYAKFALSYIVTVLLMSALMLGLVVHVARRVTIQIVKLHDIIKINLK